MAIVVMFSSRDLAQLKEQLLNRDDGLNERKPQGRPAERAVRGWAGVAPRTVLVRPVGHISRSPPPRRISASGAARACVMVGAPVRECDGVDVNTQTQRVHRP